jgi:sialidase-1
MRTASLLCVLGTLLCVVSAPAGTADWNGYEKQEFQIDGHPCYVVLPKASAPGKPWLWRARFPEYHPEPAIALLSKGFHLAYADLPNIFGNPEAVAVWDHFYDYVTRTFGLSTKMSLEGVSRGGLFVYNWVAIHPDRVNAIYCDSPVCDMKSWPGGKGKGLGSEKDWQQALAAYKFSEPEMLAFNGNPIDKVVSFAAAKIPILHIVNEGDRVVPPRENSVIFADRYRKLGAPIEVYFNRSAAETADGHHFPLDDPAMPVNFILKHTPGTEKLAGTGMTPKGKEYFKLRGGLQNSFQRFSKGGASRVVFLGGSITNMKGWRDLVCTDLKRRFPKTTFDCINAGIPSLGSTPSAFRLTRDVFANSPVDLLIEESAVNDSTNGGAKGEPLRGVEGIVRHARQINPSLDILLLHFVDPDKVAAIRAGHTPEVIAIHEQVAEHYALPSINLAQEVTERIDAGEFTWEKDFLNLHPSPFGHTVYQRSIGRLFDAAWRGLKPNDDPPRPYALPAPLDQHSYVRGRLGSIQNASLTEGWRIEEKWRPSDHVATRPGFVDVPMLIAETPGAVTHYRFEGTAIGVFSVAGPDTGTLEYSVDGKPFQHIDLFTRWSHGLHIPATQVLDGDLAPGAHELTLRVAQDSNPASKGHAIRISYLLLN